jgi:predicted SAM-dependent methyltransferase
LVEAKWSGSYPCLCYGEWTLKVDGKDVSKKIPKDLRKKSMNTFGTYQSWHFENWLEVFEDYTDGLHCEDWIEENDYWLNEITTENDVKILIYQAIQSCDFRSGSCGGCI